MPAHCQFLPKVCAGLCSVCFLKETMIQILYSLDMVTQEFMPDRTSGPLEFSTFGLEIMFQNVNHIAKLILDFFLCVSKSFGSP